MTYTVESELIEWKIKADGRMPIWIKIMIDDTRKPAYISTKHYLLPRFWDEDKKIVKSAFELAEEWNLDLLTRKQRITKKIIEYQVADTPVTAQEIKAHFSGKKNLQNIFEFVEKYIDEVDDKREPGTIINYNKHLNKLEDYAGSRELYFKAITHDWLVNYEKWLRRDKEHANNYIFDIWKVLKGFFSAARKQKIIPQDCDPFATYDNPVYVSPDKEHLTAEELIVWEEFADQCIWAYELKEAAVWFLFGCYAGLRVSDWYRFDASTQVYRGFIRLRAKKNQEWVSMPISRPLQRNLERMQCIPIKQREQTLNEKFKIVAALLDIVKDLSSHNGRHTFAVTICLYNGVSSETAAELMGITLQTFIDNYSQVTEEKIIRETEKAWGMLD